MIGELHEILCALPSYDGFVRSETAASLVNLRVPDGYFLRVRTFNGYGIADARNKMAQEAVESGSRYLLMVDSDIVIPNDGLAKLLRINSDAVATGYYPRSRGYGEETCAYPADGKPEYGDAYRISDLLKMDGVVPVKGNGLGFALMRTDIFKRLRKPWFKQRFDSKGIGLSEDMWFCKECWEKGVKVMLHTDVRCGHVVSKIL